jgi:hypothetical protein
MPYRVEGKCVYKKDTGEKVGCTEGDVDDYLAALHANTNEALFKDIATLLREQPGELDPRAVAYLRDLVGLVKNLQQQISEMQAGPQGLEAMWETFGHFQKRLLQLETGETQFPPLPDPDAPGWSQAPGTRDESIPWSRERTSENYFSNNWQGASGQTPVAEDVFKSKRDSAGNRIFELIKKEE